MDAGGQNHGKEKQFRPCSRGPASRIDIFCTAILKPKDRLRGNSRRAMKHDDAPGLEVLIDDQKPCYGAEGIEHKISDAAGAVQGYPGKQTEQDIISEIAENMIRDLPPGAAQPAAYVIGQPQIGQIGKGGLLYELDEQRCEDRDP